VTLAQLRDAARLVAKGEVGTHEVGGNNLGPRVEQYLAAAGLPPGQAWCVAFVIWSYQQAAKRGGIVSPLPRIGHVGHFVRWCMQHHDEWITSKPVVGAIACHLSDPADLDGPGHMGIIDGFNWPMLVDISGNTNAQGSRAGNLVGPNDRPLSYWNRGFIDVGRFGPPGLPSAA
jgi:hypothetical protein